jgi:hypothetical protein
MEERFSIDEILSAVNEFQNKLKRKKTENFESKPVKKDYSSVPKDTLKLIEEAEKLNNNKS